MKIGFISFHTFSSPGGVKKHILGLQKEFKNRGIDSKIIAPRRSKEENYGKDVILLGTSFPLNFSGSQSNFCINFNPSAIKKVLKKEKFDILHFHNFGFLSSLQILKKSNSLNILTFHANVEKSDFLKTFPFFLYFFDKIAQWKIDGIIGVSSLNLKIFKKFKKPKIIIPNGSDLKEFTPNGPRVEKFCDSKINILFLGRIEERKGLIYLLRAYKLLSKKLIKKNKQFPLRLIIVGEGPLRKDYQKWVKKNKLENVVFEGEIEDKMVAPYYRTCDIYCSPAIFGESFGIVLIEAMASGKPVIAFANEGYAELAKKTNETIFLAKPKDYKTLAKKLEILIKDKKLREKIGKQGIKEAEKYSWTKVADQILDFYQLCSNNKKIDNKE